MTITDWNLSQDLEKTYYSWYRPFLDRLARAGLGLADYPARTGCGTVSISGDLRCAAALSADGDVTLGSASADAVLVLGTITLAAPASFAGSATFTGDVTLGNASSDALLVNATSSFGADVACNNNLSVGGVFHANSSAVFDSTLAVSGDSTFSTYRGRRRKRRTAYTDDADHTIVMSSTDFVRVGNTLTATRNWTIDTTGLADGESIQLINASNQTENVKVGASTIWSLAAPSGPPRFVELTWDGTNLLVGLAN